MHVSETLNLFQIPNVKNLLFTTTQNVGAGKQVFALRMKLQVVDGSIMTTKSLPKSKRNSVVYDLTGDHR